MISALEFYNNNKDCIWAIEPIPSHLISTIEKAQWILNDANFGWIKLDLTIDLEGWQLEAQQADPYLVAHREDNNTGWNSCCIHGIDTDKTGAWTTYGYTNEGDVPYN